MNMNIDSIIKKDDKGNLHFGGSIALNSIMDHFYKKDRLPLSNVFFINLFTLYTNIFEMNRKDKNFQLFRDEISITKLYIETYTSLVKKKMPYFIIFYVPDYNYIPKDKRLINTLDPNKTKKNKAYNTLLKEWETIVNINFAEINTSLTINDGISIYFIKYGDSKYGLPYKGIIRDINKIKLSKYISHNIGFISHVPLDYFAINKKDTYLLERFTGNLLQNFDKKIKGINCNFNKFTIQLLGDEGRILSGHPKILPYKKQLKKLSVDNKWKLKTNDEILRDINKVIKIKYSDFITI